jgi:hypothetical protein
MSRTQQIMRIFRKHAGRRVSILEICDILAVDGHDRFKRNSVNVSVNRARKHLARYGVPIPRITPPRGHGNYAVYDVPTSILEL